MQLYIWPLTSMLIAWCSIVSGCSALIKSPEVSVKGVSLSSVSLSTLSLDVTVLVNNPNSFGMTLKSLSFDVYYQNGNDWVYLSHGEKNGAKINSGENVMDIPVTVQNTGLIRSLAGFISSGEVTLQIRGIARPDFLVIAPNVPFTYTTTIAL
jgi:LEA14-like dessication related protein